MYKNGTGINIDLLQEDDTDQPNGLEVSISSTLNNSTLQSALTQIQCFPNVVVKTDGLNQHQQDNFYCIKTFNERKIISFNNFSIIKKEYSQCYAKMGNMIYSYDYISVGDDHRFLTNGIILNGNDSQKIIKEDLLKNEEELKKFLNEISNKISNSNQKYLDLVNLRKQLILSNFWVKVKLIIFCLKGKISKG